ncbi:MAG: M14 family metallopeptidase [Comamonas sp.]
MIRSTKITASFLSADLQAADHLVSTRSAGVLTAVALAALLSACSSTPLPPWPTSGARPGTVATAPRAGGTSPVQIPGVSGNADVVSSPVGTVPLEASPLGSWQESPGVAARFPDPAVRYDTPGLADGRNTFTTNAELSQMLRQLVNSARQTGSKAELLTAGTSQEGAPIQALLLTRAAGTSLQQLDESGRPTVMLVGQQHGNEPAGSEALLVVARELSTGNLRALLDQVNVLIVPRANPDGAAANRRTTANGIDMNRDHLLLKTPEAQALAELVRSYRPIASFDSHEFTVAGRYVEKFQGVQRYDALLQTPTTGNIHEFIAKASNEWYLLPMQKALTDQGQSTNWYYTTTAKTEDRSLSMGGVRPDTGRNVNGLRNSASLLIETRGVGIGRAHIQRRVHSHVLAITSALQTTAQRSKDLMQVRSYVSRDISSQACKGQFAVDVAQTPEQRRIIFLDPTTGEDRPQQVNWNSSVKLRTLNTRPRPCGYWLSASSSDAADKLRQLGLQVLRVAEPGSLLADTYHETSRQSASRDDVRGATTTERPVEKVTVNLVRSSVDVPAGSYYVPLNQSNANLAIAALEPDTQSSFFANHIVDSLQDVARSMNNPSLVYEETD